MKILNLFIAFLASLTFASSAYAKSEKTELGSPFKVLEFNSVASNYLERPTFITLVEKNKKADRIYINADFIHKEEYAALNGGMKFLGLSKAIIDESIAAVDKYLSWEKIATRDGDIIDKDIAVIDGKGKYADIRFKFHSGNASSHYLLINACALGICNASEPMALDKMNAIFFKAFLEKWKAGEVSSLSQEKIDDKYK